MPIVYVFQMAVRNILPRLCKPVTEARYVDNIHCMLGNISSFCHLLIFFFKLNFQTLFSKCYHSIKQIGSKSRPTFIWPLTWSKLFAKIISRKIGYIIFVLKSVCRLSVCPCVTFLVIIPAFFFRKKGYINFMSKSVSRPSVCPSVRPSVRTSVRHVSCKCISS